MALAFPSDNVEAAKAWLNDEMNRLFAGYYYKKAWIGKDWESLEDMMKQVTGLKNVVYLIKSEAAGVLEQTETRQHLKNDQREDIIRKATATIMTQMTTSWKDNSEVWIERAVDTFLPRAVALSKKSSGKKKNENKSRPGVHPELTQQPSQDTTIRKRPADNTEGREPRGKRVRANSEGLVEMQPGCALLLVNRNIDIEYQPLPPEAENLHIIIGISAIIAKKYCTRTMEEIRSDHLDFNKFQNIVSSQEPDINFNQSTYEWSIASQPYCSPNSESFETGVGLGVMDLEKERSGRDIQITLKAVED